MDVRQKQRLSYRVASCPFACPLSVFAHVISTVRQLSMKPKYEKIEQQSKAEIEVAILRDDPDELVYAILSAALYSENFAWAENICARLATHQNEKVRGIALLGFEHIARIHEQLTEATVKPLIEAALDDEKEYVRGQAEDVKDALKFFLRWRFKRRKKQSA